jgi:hypothetical protein
MRGDRATTEQFAAKRKDFNWRIAQLVDRC